MAQNSDLYTIKLKSGLIIKCELVKIVPDSFIVIKQYGLVSTIPYKEIASLEMSETKVNRAGPPSQPEYVVPEKKKVYKRPVPDTGWTMAIGTGLCFGVHADGFPAASVMLRFNTLKRVSKRWQMGAMIGLDPYSKNGAFIAPLAAETRYNLRINKPKTTFMFGQAGYGFNLTADNLKEYGGAYYCGGIGRAFRQNDQTVFSIMLGYRIQNMKQDVYSGSPQLNTEVVRTYFYQVRRFEYKVEWRF